MIKRTKQILIKVSNSEKEKIESEAKRLGLSISDYIRYKSVYGGV